MSTQDSKADIVVLGAGVIGLSIALELANAGYKPAVVARDLPEDQTSTGFASPWAGCNWHTFETVGGTPAAERDAATFRRLAALAEAEPELCKRIDFFDLYTKPVSKDTVWWKDLTEVKEVESTSNSPLPTGFPFAHSYQSYILHAPNYILYLASQLRKAGVPLLRYRLSSLDEAYDLPDVGPVDLVVNATGLGALSLIGVEDDQVYPARGQTVLVRAPKATTCYMLNEGFGAFPGVTAETIKPPVYMIPRPGTDGHIILGGTYLPDNYSTLPDLREADRIMQECFAVEPNLAPGGTWRDMEVVSHNVGLRPARKGGARVELEKRSTGTQGGAVAPPLRGEARQVAVIHAYGFGGAGYQASLGTAEQVVNLAREYLP